MPNLLKSVRDLLRRGSWEKYNGVGDQKESEMVLENRYEKISLLQKGADGIVYLGVDKLTGFYVAIKCLTRSVEASAMEVVISNCIGRGCSRCLPTLDTYESEGLAHIVSPLMENGDLFDYIFDRNNGLPVDHSDMIDFDDSLSEYPQPLSVDATMIHFAQMALGLEEIHNMGFVHGDIKLDNVLVDARGRLRIGDYGRARKYSTEVKDRFHGGTLFYSAPETITGQKIFGPEMDIWSLAVCLFIMLSGYFPFGSEEWICKGVYVPIAVNLPRGILHLLNRMLCTSPSRRITMRDLLKQKVMQKYLRKVQSPAFWNEKRGLLAG